LKTFTFYNLGDPMKTSLNELFARTKIRPSRESYVFVGLRKTGHFDELLRRLDAFSSVTIEKDEISLVLKRKLWNRYSSHYREAKVSGPYRLIAFDIVMDLEVCGYFARISKLLEETQISIMPVSTYLRDYVLVPEASYRKAVVTINRFLMRQRRIQSNRR